jgi:16S rRNA (adenine1518-N6/adenine1519-N6)-dimethyltransferase
VTHSRRDVLDLLDRHGLKPSRALGQNFVADANTVRRIARLAEVGPGDRVIEVGAGLGSLTLALVETGADVTAIEVDRHILPALRDVVANTAVTIVEADAMSVDWHALVDDRDHVLVANLPYNIATPLVADLLDEVPQLVRMLVMVQREVGERLAAHVGDDGYGAVSVKVDYWAEARIVGHVPPSVFVPKPNVASALVRIDRRARQKVDVEPSLLFPLVRAGFAQRRKMLRRALAGVIDLDAFACAAVRPEARAEELDVDAWGRLARCAHRPS